MLKKIKDRELLLFDVNLDIKEVVEQPTSTITEQKRGGFTCCVPLCYNNSPKLTRVCLFMLFLKSLCLEKRGCI